MRRDIILKESGAPDPNSNVTSKSCRGIGPCRQIRRKTASNECEPSGRRSQRRDPLRSFWIERHRQLPPAFAMPNARWSSNAEVAAASEPGCQAVEKSPPPARQSAAELRRDRKKVPAAGNEFRQREPHPCEPPEGTVGDEPRRIAAVGNRGGSGACNSAGRSETRLAASAAPALRDGFPSASPRRCGTGPETLPDQASGNASAPSDTPSWIHSRSLVWRMSRRDDRMAVRTARSCPTSTTTFLPLVRAV